MTARKPTIIRKGKTFLRVTKSGFTIAQKDLRFETIKSGKKFGIRRKV